MGFWPRTERGSLPEVQVTQLKSSAAVAPGNHPTLRAARPLEQQWGSDWEKGPERHRWGAFGQVRRWFTQGWRPPTRDRGAKAAGRTMAQVQRCEGRQNRAEEPASGGHGGRRGSRRGHGIVCKGRVRRGAVGAAATASGSDGTARRWRKRWCGREWGAGRMWGLGGSCRGCEKPESRKTDQNLSRHLVTWRTAGPRRDALWTAARGGGKRGAQGTGTVCTSGGLSVGTRGGGAGAGVDTAALTQLALEHLGQGLATGPAGVSGENPEPAAITSTLRLTRCPSFVQGWKRFLRIT